MISSSLSLQKRYLAGVLSVLTIVAAIVLVAAPAVLAQQRLSKRYPWGKRSHRIEERLRDHHRRIVEQG